MAVERSGQVRLCCSYRLGVELMARPLFSSLPKKTSPALGSWAVGGLLLGVLLALVVYAPASWVAAAVASLSQNKVQLLDAQGRLWQGSGRLLLQPGGQKPVLLPERLRWTASLQGLGLQVSLWPECCASRPALVHWQPGWGGQRVQLQNLDVRLPATLLAGLGTPFNTLGFDGTVVLSSPQLRLQAQGQKWQLEGAAQMQLLQLSSSLATLPALGSYRIDVAGGAGNIASVQLSTLSGALQLQGSGGWQNRRFGFDGQAQAAPGYEDSLANILNVIGQRRGAVSVFRI